MEDKTRVLEAASILIEKGNVDACERRLRSKYNIDADQAQEMAAEAMIVLLSGAPREIRQSFETVISWHRWNAMYQRAAKNFDTDTQVVAQKQLDALMTRIH